MWWLQGTLQYRDNNITMIGINKALMFFSCALPSTPDWSIVGSFGLERCDNMTPCPLISIQIPPGDDVRCWSKSHRRYWPSEFNPETPGAPSRKTHPKRLTLSLSQNREGFVKEKCLSRSPQTENILPPRTSVTSLRRCWGNIQELQTWETLENSTIQIDFLSKTEFWKMDTFCFWFLRIGIKCSKDILKDHLHAEQQRVVLPLSYLKRCYLGQRSLGTWRCFVTLQTNI